MRILFIYRALEFSPNNVQSDAAILDAVADRFLSSGAEVVRYSEAALPAGLDAFDVIFHMARRPATLTRLSQLVHAKVINPPQGVSLVSSSRGNTMALLQSVGISVPRWMSLKSADIHSAQFQAEAVELLPGWIKGIRHTGSSIDDVNYVSCHKQMLQTLLRLECQPLEDLVLTQHLKGDLLKCYYVVSDEPFLHWFYPQEVGYSKFGTAERHNGNLMRILFPIAQLEALAQGIAKAIGLQVFGFDVIVSPQSARAASPCLSVIDVNDWPSFGVCRPQAAKAIARLINTDQHANS